MVVKSEQKLDECGENEGTTLLGGEYWKMAWGVGRVRVGKG